jgi:capsular exopolysaccharide synthesis family protein
VSLTLPGPAAAGWNGNGAASLADQFLFLRRHWRLIFAVAGIVAGATCLAVAGMPTTYTASGVLLYDPAGAVTPGDPLPAPELGQTDQDAVTASQAAIIASLPAARALAGALNFSADANFNPALRNRTWPFTLLPAPEPPDQRAIVAAIRRALVVTATPGSRIITVAFTAADPALAAAAANAAMQLYLDHERDQAVGALDESRDWIAANTAALQARLDGVETQLAQARAAAGVVAGAQASLTTETASRLAASLVQAQADLAADQARLSSAAAGIEDAPASGEAAADAAVAPNLQPLRKEQADLTAQVQSLAGAYGADYPPLAAARTALDAISTEIGAETGREIAAAKAQVAADQAEIATLGQALAAARAEDQAEDADSAPIRALEERADAGRDMLRAMTLQADQLAQQAALIRPDARIISDAAAPADPDPRHRLLITAAALGLGLCLGVLLAGVREALDSSFRSGFLLREATGLTCLAQIPETRDPRHAVLAAPFSLFAEQIRALRTGMALAGPERRVIAVTAARPGEGKTTLTIALGRGLAAAGLRVVALDGDIRQPSFDPVFGLGGALGLTDHLAGGAELDAIIRPDRDSALHVIAAGGQAQAALSLFLSPALPLLLANLRARYDVVLIDVPPALALAEGRVLARAADAALLCVRWGDTPRGVVASAITLLREANVNLIGVALTRVNATAHGRSGFPDAEIYQPRYGGYFRELR